MKVNYLEYLIFSGYNETFDKPSYIILINK